MSDEIFTLANEQPETEWLGHCRRHGSVSIKQSARPTFCRREVRISQRCTRLCRAPLLDVRRRALK